MTLPKQATYLGITLILLNEIRGIIVAVTVGWPVLREMIW